jgi:hypothetical protein
VGQVVVLPSELVSPFAKLAAFLDLQHSHRYAFGQTYISVAGALLAPDAAAGGAGAGSGTDGGGGKYSGAEGAGAAAAAAAAAAATATRLNSAGGSHDHPIISEEAVYDVILPLNAASVTDATAAVTPTAASSTAAAAASSSSSSKGDHTLDSSSSQSDSSSSVSRGQSCTIYQADFEVLTAAIEATHRLTAYLPDCAIRVTDPRLLDCILEICAWVLPEDPEGVPIASAAAPGAPGAPGASSCGRRSGELPAGVDRAALSRVLSLVSDGYMTQAEVQLLLRELRLPPIFLRRLLPFAYALSARVLNDRRAAAAATAAASGVAASAASVELQEKNVLLLMLDALEFVRVHIFISCFSIIQFALLRCIFLLIVFLLLGLSVFFLLRRSFIAPRSLSTSSGA